jgi:hypothetical protein
MELSKIKNNNNFLPTLMQQHQDKNPTFITFKTFSELDLWYRSQPILLRNFYEIIYNKPQKPRFDLEISSDKLSFDVWNYYVNNIIETIYKKFTNVILTIYNSHGKKKWSTHIIVQNYIVKNCEDARKFTMCIIHALPNPIIKTIIDLSVYKSLQMFRLEGSTKVGENRYKYKPNTNQLCDNFVNELISNINNQEIQILPSSPDYNYTFIKNNDNKSSKFK